MFVDLSIISAHGAHDVLAHNHRVSLPDGSSVALHWVAVHNMPASSLRALQVEGTHWLVVNVRDLGGHALMVDLASLPRRDGDGLVAWYVSRQHANAAAVELAAWSKFQNAWAIDAGQMHIHSRRPISSTPRTAF